MDKSSSKKEMEFSKKIFLIVAVLNFLILAFACVMMWKLQDISPLSYIIPSVFAEFATSTGFYYNKAKSENKIKLMKKSGVEPTHEDFTSF